MNTENIKQSHNIVDYINQYVPLKPSGSGEFKALCPFHSEKTPSFTVSEKKQFYYCHGCGATGDVINFVETYQGCDFIDACKILGGEVDEMDLKTVSANRARPLITYPKFDKRDAVKTAKYIESCGSGLIDDVYYYEKKGEWLVAVFDLDLIELVNLYNVRNGKFLCKGISHRASTCIRRNALSQYIIVVDFDDAIKLKHKYKDKNIMIAYSAFNMKLIVDNFNYNFIPAITADDTHAHSLTEAHDYVFIDGDGQFIEKRKGEDYE